MKAIQGLIKATPPSAIAGLRMAASTAEQMSAKRAAEAAAEARAVAHGDVGISTPTDGGVSFIAETPEGRAPYQPLAKKQAKL